MNNSTLEVTNNGPDYNQESVGSFGYSMGITFGILLALIIITYFYYIHIRFRANVDNRNRPFFRRGSINTTATSTSSSSNSDESSSNTPQGLDDATLVAYPKILYSEAKINQEGGCCSICLQDYKESDMLRLLPECGHFFHLKCVDLWLKLHPTCPICRNGNLC
ncbi:hypothetical protein ACH5RR_019073 [Cinchona calisaya]|uniref:RING-type domain-containing protein n=1 Tax=Cinchona calisaya TaxID=153742 RepID=A0ABD2ZP75_9GENT